jgi:hypothetical protein
MIKIMNDCMIIYGSTAQWRNGSTAILNKCHQYKYFAFAPLRHYAFTPLRLSPFTGKFRLFTEFSGI